MKNAKQKYFSKVETDDDGIITGLRINHQYFYMCKNPDCRAAHPDGQKCDKTPKND